MVELTKHPNHREDPSNLPLLCKWLQASSPLQTGAPVVPDPADPSRAHDGRAKWEWQIHGLAGVVEGPGEAGGSGGCGPHH